MPLFEYKAYSTHPAIVKQAEVLVEEMLSLRKRKPDKKSKAQYFKWMKVAIAGLYLIGGYQKDSVQIPVNRNLYYGKTRRNELYQPELLKCFMWLRDAGYIEETKHAHQDKNGNWTPAAYALTRKWLDVACHFSPYDERKHQIIKSIVRNPSLPVIELRKDGRRMRTNPHKDKWLWEKRIKAYNERLSYFDFRLVGEVLPAVTFSVTRIFNDGSYDRGGRYYSTAQGFKSQLRLHLKIDNEPVMEVDYRGLHPSLLYQRAGLEEPIDDAYTIEGYPRKLVKKAFNILINRKKPAPATKSLIFYLNKNKKEYVDEKHPTPPTINTEYCIALEKAIRDHHKPIEHFFCTGVGLELQNHDSLLCSHIFDYFLAKTKTIVLAVHDSFIVKQSDMQHLAEAIRHAEFAVARSLGVPYREPLLEAEVIHITKGYQEDLAQYFGLSMSPQKVTEEESLITDLNNELELLDDIESLADEDADAIDEIA
jgi:hypothetical protein